MPSLKTASCVVLLATICAAQSEDRQLLADVVLAQQSAVNSSIECGRYYDDVIPKSIVMRISNKVTSGTCFNVAETFSPSSYPNDTITEFEGITSSCWPLNSSCQSALQADGLNIYSPEANYTHIEVNFRNLESTATKEFRLKAFAGDRCEEDAAEPWFSWGGCGEDDGTAHCDELPYNVKSLKVERVASDNSTECLVAAERGAGARVGQTDIAALVGGAIVAGLMAVV
ncbi:hypothetical protein CB0940_02403 [Cercospora beticola]|uniref:Secreted protein n=1 Tax=Cercospora beticola TaxID=122368 RepID=A0A2G5I2P0_CERBT|nr:hypothetical protein CB0940_02403 [Cercospora beticola]PIA98763.1 hypothetical protein CB0940_02403 [Cercospora beticola]WPA99539.1 hypothetical protein RHO25_004157 [Cercospora beticola]